jgi:hypothetical protein
MPFFLGTFKKLRSILFIKIQKYRILFSFYLKYDLIDVYCPLNCFYIKLAYLLILLLFDNYNQMQ